MDFSSALFLLFTAAIALIVPATVPDMPDNFSVTIYDESRNISRMALTPVLPPVCKYNATLYIGDTETSYYQLQELKRLNQSIVQRHISVRNVSEDGVAAFSVQADMTPHWRRSDGVVIGTFQRANDIRNELKCLS